MQGLRRIEPSVEYARNSRRLILASKNSAHYGEFVESIPRPSIFAQAAQSLSFAFETALVAALFLVVILGGVFGLSKSLFLPPLQGIDEEALLTEAGAINHDINLKLDEIAYFGTHKTSTERVVALSADKTRPQAETAFLTEVSTDQEIDKLLNRVINDY